MSSFSLVITPPDGSRPGFTVRSSSALPRRCLSAIARAKQTGSKTENNLVHTTLRYHAIARILSFGSWLEPRYIFAAGQLD